LEIVMDNDTAPAVEIEELYCELAPQLRRVLKANLQVPEYVLEDACQVAWTTLLADPGQVDRPRMLSWLATTARREALTMLKRSEIELRAASGCTQPEPMDPHRAAEFWERMGQVRRLSRRQQQIVWMQGLGFRYEEIAAETGETRRSVQRQLLAARKRLDAAA
jgi:RNA polymerase sigma factor (sigma-70 family)